MDLETSMKLYSDFKNAKPFPHIVLPDFLEEKTAKAISKDFPEPEPDWYSYDNVFEKKRAMDKINRMPPSIAEFMLYANSHLFIEMIERITGIEGLIPDPSFRGGGMHAIMPGGKLDVHKDFNQHPKLKVYRRVNVIVYLNESWREEWGGHLELWDKDMKKCHQKIAPKFNTCVIFSTPDSPHGHPDPLKCPEGVFRKSLALYYYTFEAPTAENVIPMSTQFLRRPTDIVDPKTEELRQKRNHGRIIISG